MLFEAHVTFDRDLATLIKLNLHVDAFKKWKYSQIDGDPVLGKKVFCYLTAHDASGESLSERTKAVVAKARELGFAPVRAKIEQIIYDERF